MGGEDLFSIDPFVPCMSFLLRFSDGKKCNSNYFFSRFLYTADDQTINPEPLGELTS